MRIDGVVHALTLDDLRRLVNHVIATLPEGAPRLRFTTNHDETAWDALMDVLRGEPIVSGQTLSLGPYDYRLLRVA